MEIETDSSNEIQSFQKKNLEKKLPWSTMKGIERETGKKNKNKTVMKEMGTERKAMKMLMRSKGSFFYFIFFPSWG